MRALHNSPCIHSSRICFELHSTPQPRCGTRLAKTLARTMRMSTCMSTDSGRSRSLNPRAAARARSRQIRPRRALVAVARRPPARLRSHASSIWSMRRHQRTDIDAFSCACLPGECRFSITNSPVFFNRAALSTSPPLLRPPRAIVTRWHRPRQLRLCARLQNPARIPRPSLPRQR